MIPARPTTYKGIRMRSRLEARFAAFLDNEGYPWTYEPRAYAGDGGQYLPDFELRVQGGLPTFVEVKPTMESALMALPRMQIIWESEPLAVLIMAVADGPILITNGRERRWESFTTFGWPS